MERLPWKRYSPEGSAGQAVEAYGTTTRSECTRMFKLSRDDMRSALEELGTRAVEAGKIIDLCVYGGLCLMMVSNSRAASQDIDAVAMTDQTFVDRTSAEIAERRGWPIDWLNDGVRTYLSPNVDEIEDHSLSATYPSEKNPGLRVYTPTAEYMLAMKLMSMRIDEPGGGRDHADIINLMQVGGIKDKAELITIASRFYPEARVSGKLILAADALIKENKSRARSRNAAPKYADRSGCGREG